MSRAWNARLRENVPGGFALDENHTPHITLLQRYVSTDQLDDVYQAIGTTVASVQVEGLDLTAVKLAHMEVEAAPGMGLAGVLVKAGQTVIDLQAALIAAIEPFTGSGGTAEAYVTSVAEPDINDDTLGYVEAYVPTAASMRVRAPHEPCRSPR